MSFSQGFGGSFIASSPSPSPVTPAQSNLLQPNFDAAFGTSSSTSTAGSSFDASGKVVCVVGWVSFLLIHIHNKRVYLPSKVNDSSASCEVYTKISRKIDTLTFH